MSTDDSSQSPTVPKNPRSKALARNQACLTCRTRKVKCDAIRPICGACSRSAQHRGNDAPKCVWDDDESGAAPVKSAKKQGGKRVSALEDKIAELEKMIKGNTSPTESSDNSPPVLQEFPASNQYPSSSTAPQSAYAAENSQVFASLNSFSAYSMPPANNFSSNFVTSDFLNPQTNQGVDGTLHEIFYSGWPSSLPNPNLVNSLIDVYFAHNHTATGMINPTRFLAHLALPPNHRDFPHVSLLHAMLAVACRFVAEDAFSLDKELYWQMGGDASASDYHCRMAKTAIDDAIAKGQRLFTVVQAVVLVCFHAYHAARFVEVWLYCGIATRLATPLGLNHIESIAAGKLTMDTEEGRAAKHANAAGVKPTLLPPPADEVERQERAVTFWMCFAADRYASASTAWAFSLDERDITTFLPDASACEGPMRMINANNECASLSISSPTFFTSNPSNLVNYLGLHLKAIILLGRVVNFLQRSPWPIGMDMPEFRGPEAPKPPADLRTTKAFKRLDSDIVAFRMSFPKELRNILQKTPDGRYASNLITAHVIPHTATILLHEGFCGGEGELSMQRCLTSARAILGMVYLLWSSSFDIGLLNPFMNFCWSVAGRTLVRDLAMKQMNKDEQGAGVILQECNVILSAMTSYGERSPLGKTCADAMRLLLQDPDKCHPRHGNFYKFRTTISVHQDDSDLVASTARPLGINSNNQYTNSRNQSVDSDYPAVTPPLSNGSNHSHTTSFTPPAFITSISPSSNEFQPSDFDTTGIQQQQDFSALLFELETTKTPFSEAVLQDYLDPQYFSENGALRQ